MAEAAAVAVATMKGSAMYLASLLRDLSWAKTGSRTQSSLVRDDSRYLLQRMFKKGLCRRRMPKIVSLQNVLAWFVQTSRQACTCVVLGGVRMGLYPKLNRKTYKGLVGNMGIYHIGILFPYSD